MFYLQAVGGLCNRILAIDSALSLANNFGMDLAILWEINDLLNCQFTELFEFDERVFSLTERVEKNYFFRQVHKLSNFIRFDKFIYTSEFKRLRDSNYDFNKLSSYKSIYICGFNRFDKGYNLARHFKPVPFLQKKINTSIDRFTKKTIGLHLRRTDHKDAIAKSSTNQFIEKINAELLLDDQIIFFLTTDSPEDEERLKTIFGNKIITNKSRLERNSKEGIQDALIDLYCLAATNKIYGSYKSSFSEAAAEIGKNQLIIIE